MNVTWEERLKEQAERDFKNYSTFTIKLDSAKINDQKNIPGDCIYVNKVSSASAAATIRLNRNTNEPIELKLHTKIATVFTSLFISNDAQAGEWIELLVGIDFNIQNLLAGNSLGTIQPVVKLTHANPNTDISPSAQIANKACVKANVTNTQTVWVDFKKAAVQDSCYPLDPGDSISVDLKNLNEIHANFEVGGECVFIAYEV